jgi:deoxycytidylate deaminase
VLLPFEAVDVLAFEANAAVPEMHDRMIAGVAKRLQIPCLTCDKQIVNSGLVQVVW